MKQHPSLLRSSFISRGFLAGLAVAVVAFSSGCSSSSSSDGGSTPGTTGPVIDASELGQSCSGGTSSGDTVALQDSTCKGGFCLADDSGGDLDSLQVYCTADCSNAQCPAGFTCKKTTLESSYDCFQDSVPDGGGS